MPAPLAAGNATGEGEESNKLRTTMEAMEKGTEAVAEGDEGRGGKEYH